MLVTRSLTYACPPQVFLEYRQVEHHQSDYMVLQGLASKPQTPVNGRNILTASYEIMY